MNTKDELKATILKHLKVLSPDRVWEVFFDEPDVWLALESEEAVRAAREIADAAAASGIPRPTHLEVIQAVGRFIDSQFAREGSEYEAGEEWVDLLINEFKPKDLSKFVFSVPIGITRAVRVNGSLGGPYDLKLTTKEIERGVFSGWRGETVGEVAEVTLSGQIPAHDCDEAMKILNEQLKLLMGAGFAIGLARVGRIRKDLSAQSFSASLSVDGVKKYEEFLDREVDWLVERCVFGLFQPLNDLDKRRMESGDAQGVADKRVRLIASVYGPSSETQIASACSLLGDAVSARDDGLSVAVALMSAEAALLEPNDANSLLARLSEAVAFRLGSSSAERREVRKRVKKLYAARSRFVHRGESAGPIEREEAILLALAVLRLELTKGA